MKVSYQNRVFALVVAGFFLFIANVYVQSQGSTSLATLQGVVRDSTGHSVAAATVQLETEDGSQTLTARTDANGLYKFHELKAGNYRLRAQMSGYEKTADSSCVIGQSQTKKIDLTLGPRNPLASNDVSRNAPEFFDQPAFTVAGVTDAANAGGHGSTTALRTTETLSEDVRSLNHASPAELPNGSSRASLEQETSLRRAVQRDPGGFEANFRLGELLVEEGKSSDGIPYLERASQLRPSNYENSYELATAYAAVGKHESARSNVERLLVAPQVSSQNEAALHHLLGDIDERSDDPLNAVREYQRAAELSPTEANVFDWGSELLTHHAEKPAIEVFTTGNRLFPHSTRMLIGLAVANYGLGSYDEAVQRLCAASDLDPDDPAPYLLLGKMQNVGSHSPDAVAKRLERFARLQPENAIANYYHALSLWNARKVSEKAANSGQIESLLDKAVHIDPKLGAAYLLQGTIYADREDFPRAIAAYEKAIEVSPDLEEAHYRLSQAYSRTGDPARAQEQIQLFQRISKAKDDQAERNRREAKQFVYTLRDPTTTEHP